MPDTSKKKVDLHYGIRIRHYNELYWYAMMRVSALLVTFLSRKHGIGIVFYAMNSNDVIFTAICSNRIPVVLKTRWIVGWRLAMTSIQDCPIHCVMRILLFPAGMVPLV